MPKMLFLNVIYNLNEEQMCACITAAVTTTEVTTEVYMSVQEKKVQFDRVKLFLNPL